MLTIQRKINEHIILVGSDGPMTICLAKIDRNKASIAIDAPRHVKIIRDELIMNLREIAQTTGMDPTDTLRYHEILHHFQEQIGCPNIQLRTLHQEIMEYARRRGLPLVSAAFAYLAQKRQQVVAEYSL